jgi:hypothetical protein
MPVHKAEEVRGPRGPDVSGVDAEVRQQPVPLASKRHGNSPNHAQSVELATAGERSESRAGS